MASPRTQESDSNIVGIDLGIKQSEQHALGIGQHFAPGIIDEVYEFAQTAQAPPIYTSHSDIPVVYELLKREGWREKILHLAESWTQNIDNIMRAEKCVGRKAQTDTEQLVRAFGLFRLRARSDSTDWISVPDGLGNDARKLQTTVYIALMDLNPENGFFMHLRKGEDVCIDSKANIKFPPPGGGLGISFVLDL